MPPQPTIDGVEPLVGSALTQARSRRLTTAFVGLAVVSVVVAILEVPTYGIAAQLVTNGTFVAVGAVIARRRPGNIIGLLSTAHGSLMVLNLTLNLIALRLAEDGSLDAAGLVALVSMVLFPFSAGLQVPLFLAFPDGSRPTRAARWFLGVWVIAITIMTMVALFARPTIIVEPDIALPHPFVDRQTADDLLPISDQLIFLLVLMMLGTMPVLVRRWRRGGPVERRQIGWLGLAYFTYTVVATVNTALQPSGSTGGDMFLLVDSVGVIVPLALAVAILRYRLYDIDVIITKTVLFLGLAGMITVVYAAVIAGSIALIGAPDGGLGVWVPVVATVVVAVVFEPIRVRLQRWANHLVYGERATRHEVLSQTSAALADEGGRDSADELTDLLARGTGAVAAYLWIRDGTGFRTVGSHPPDLGEVVATALPERSDTEDWRVIEHRGELLGAVSVVKPANDPVAPADGAVLDDVAAVAALHVRRLALTEQLEDRVREVRRSRRRLVAAQDTERRRLERDLHDGAQQHVVALNVKLGIARTLASRDGNDELAALIDGLATDAQRTVADLRDVAHGIYPPLLAVDGLGPALGSLGDRIGVEVCSGPLGRYEPGIEQTAYFAVVETLEHVRLAGADSASVSVDPVSAGIAIEITAVCVPPESDLSTVADRLEAFGGKLDADVAEHIVRAYVPAAPEPVGR